MPDSKEAYIVDAIRTPIGNFRGSLSPIRTDDLAAHTIKELMNRNPDIETDQINDVIFGCATKPEKTTGMSPGWLCF